MPGLEERTTVWHYRIAARKYHEEGCTCGYLNPVFEWAGGSYVVIVAYECPECKKRTPVSEFLPKIAG